MKIQKNTLLKRFIRYVRIDTQSDPFSETVPSTLKQKDLWRVLVDELQGLWVENAHMDEHGYVYAHIPSNSSKKLPSLGFCSHMDTSPDVSWANVTPQIIENYQWWDISITESVVLTVKENPELLKMTWKTIISTDGTTLLWSDDKAWIAEIMTFIEFIYSYPETKHPDISICFTPDEEIWRGTDHIDLKKFSPTYAYTVDGWSKGKFESVNFNADKLSITFTWKAMHTWYAKDKLINAVKVASDFVTLFPEEKSPEHTSHHQGFFHPGHINWKPWSATVKCILRSFQMKELDEFATMITSYAQKVVDDHPWATYEAIREKQYRNMAQIVSLNTWLTEIALMALHNLWIEPIQDRIRWGTDGAKLTELWIPCPNLFAGGHNFHSVKEWICLEDMEDAVSCLEEINRLRCDHAREGGK